MGSSPISSSRDGAGTGTLPADLSRPGDLPRGSLPGSSVHGQASGGDRYSNVQNSNDLESNDSDTDRTARRGAQRGGGQTDSQTISLPDPTRWASPTSNKHQEHGQGSLRTDETARQRGHDRSRRPRQDHTDVRDLPLPGGQGNGQVDGLRRHRQGSRGEGARDHHLDRPRRIRDRKPPLRARGLPGPRRLREEHDHGCGADGRRDRRCLGRGRSHAPDAGAHPAGEAGERAGARGLHEQGRPGRRRRAARPRRDGDPRAAQQVRVPR